MSDWIYADHDPVLYTHTLNLITKAMDATVNASYEQGVVVVNAFERYSRPKGRMLSVSLYNRHIASLHEAEAGGWAVAIRDQGFPTQETQHVLQAVLDAAFKFKYRIEPGIDAEFFPALYVNSTEPPDHTGQHFIPKYKWLDLQEV